MITLPGAPSSGSVPAAPQPARFAEPRRAAIDGPTLTGIRHAIEATYPGWRVWMSDGGHPYAVRATHGPGQGVTVSAPAIGLVSYEIALYEHQERIAVQRAQDSQSRLAADRMAAGLMGGQL